MTQGLNEIATLKLQDLDEAKNKNRKRRVVC